MHLYRYSVDVLYMYRIVNVIVTVLWSEQELD